MGGNLSCINDNKMARIVFLGLDAAGKTTILYKFVKSRETIDTFPTMGFNSEQITHQNLSMMFWDFGGRMIVRYNYVSSDYFYFEFQLLFSIPFSSSNTQFYEFRISISPIHEVAECFSFSF
jgi:GTPase SAR1 family protein